MPPPPHKVDWENKIVVLSRELGGIYLVIMESQSVFGGWAGVMICVVNGMAKIGPCTRGVTYGRKESINKARNDGQKKRLDP